MRRLHCPVCGHEVFFDSLHCLRCATTLAMAPGDDEITVADLGTTTPCVNRVNWACNWPADPAGPFCRSCVLVDAAGHEHDPAMLPFQLAQRRALNQMTRLRMPWSSGASSGPSPTPGQPPLRLRYRSKSTDAGVVIGHRGGVITLDLDEADAAVQEGIRARLGEQYRTPLGHLRHELGHYVWLTLVRPAPAQLDEFRQCFGDERADYKGALRDHYLRSDDGTWRDQYASYYASAHPWEDFAESWAQLMHIHDVVETGAAWGVVRAPPDTEDATAWLAASIQATLAANELARAMGMRDLYPFALSAGVLAKVAFCWRLVHLGATASR